MCMTDDYLQRLQYSGSLSKPANLCFGIHYSIFWISYAMAKSKYANATLSATGLQLCLTEAVGTGLSQHFVIMFAA